ncbi:hypothetical protein TB2_008327 [Malus domestica]
MELDDNGEFIRVAVEEGGLCEIGGTGLQVKQGGQIPEGRVRSVSDLHGVGPSSRGYVTLVLGDGLLTGSKRGKDKDAHARDEVPVVYKKSVHAMEFKKCGLGFQNAVIVASNGRSGGLCLLWNDEVEVVVRSSLPNHIDMECRIGGSSTWWRFTGFYGFQNIADCHLSWVLLSPLSRQSSLPWLYVGDFNEMLSAFEQLGGVGRRNSQMNGFREAVHDCGLVDLGFIGSEYTWTDNRDDEDASCENTIADAWSVERRGAHLTRVCDKIRATRVALLDWQRNTFRNTKLEIAKVRDKLGILFDHPHSSDLYDRR